MTSEFTDEKKHDKNDQIFHAGFTHNPLPLLVQGDMWDSRLDSPWILLTKLQLHTTSKLTARNKASSDSDRCFRMRARETTFDLWPCVYLPHPETNFSPVCGEKFSLSKPLCLLFTFISAEPLHFTAAKRLVDLRSSAAAPWLAASDLTVPSWEEEVFPWLAGKQEAETECISVIKSQTVSAKAALGDVNSVCR